MLRVPMEKRVEMVRSLEMFGLSYREIGSALGMSAATAWRAAKETADAVSNETPTPPKPKPIPKPKALNKRGNLAFGKIATGSLEVQAVFQSRELGVHQAVFIKETRDSFNYALEQLLKLQPMYEDIPPVPLTRTSDARMWFPIDDKAHSDDVWRRSNDGTVAMGVYALCGSYAMDHLTDGHIPSWFVAGITGGKRAASYLMQQKIWVAVDDGYQWVEWPEKLTRAGVERERKLARERKARQREKGESD